MSDLKEGVLPQRLILVARPMMTIILWMDGELLGDQPL